MAYKNLISVNGTELPQPSKYIGLTATVVDNARNVDGFFIGAVVREDMGKVEADYNYLTAGQWSAILKLFSMKHGGSFSQPVEFFCQLENGWVTREMYVGDRTSGGAHDLDPETGAIAGWINPHLSLVEV